MHLTSIYLSAQPNASHVKYTSAQPFTPQFVKDHLTRDAATATTAKKLSSSRAQALYEERVHRRQLGLAKRIQNRRTKEKKKGLVVVKMEKMSRREAAEKGVWRLRKKEARCVRARVMLFCYFLLGFRWDAFVPLHRLWLGYMSELLGLATVDTQEHSQSRTAAAAAM